MFEYGWTWIIIHLIVVGHAWLWFGLIMADHVWLWFDHVKNMIDYYWMWVDHGCFWFMPFGLSTWCKLWCMPQCDIAIDEHHNMTWTLMNITMQHPKMFISHCDVHQWLCQIATYIKVYIALRHLSMAMSYYDVH